MGLEEAESSPTSPTGWSRFVGTLDVGLRIRVDVIGPDALPRTQGAKHVSKALREVLASHELVYLNGHSFRGAIAALGEVQTFASEHYGVLMLDTCWSTQLYGLAALRASKAMPRLDIIVNDEESVTGSVFGFSTLLRSLSAGAKRFGRNQRVAPWGVVLGELNRLADTRADLRRRMEPGTDYPDAERYRLAQLRTHVSLPK